MIPRESSQELRQSMKSILAALDPRWVRAASNEVGRLLCQLIENDISKPVKHILAWSRFFSGEVDLSYFISSQLGSREVYLPRINTDGTMLFISIGKDWISEDPDQILDGSSSTGTPFQISEIEQAVILVPGLAFNKQGDRIGIGLGHYQKLFQNEFKDICKIGVCWSLQILDSVVGKGGKVQMDWICNEGGYFKASEEKVG